MHRRTILNLGANVNNIVGKGRSWLRRLETGNLWSKVAITGSKPPKIHTGETAELPGLDLEFTTA